MEQKESGMEQRGGFLPRDLPVLTPPIETPVRHLRDDA
jgi:hypothetical protein